jgi:hypothetical protein
MQRQTHGVGGSGTGMGARAPATRVDEIHVDFSRPRVRRCTLRRDSEEPEGLVDVTPLHLQQERVKIHGPLLKCMCIAENSTFILNRSSCSPLTHSSPELHPGTPTTVAWQML